jgi:hypothetical protein
VQKTLLLHSAVAETTALQSKSDLARTLLNHFAEFIFREFTKESK